MSRDPEVGLRSNPDTVTHIPRFNEVGRKMWTGGRTDTAVNR